MKRILVLMLAVVGLFMSCSNLIEPITGNISPPSWLIGTYYSYSHKVVVTDDNILSTDYGVTTNFDQLRSSSVKIIGEEETVSGNKSYVIQKTYKDIDLVYYYHFVYIDEDTIQCIYIHNGTSTHHNLTRM